MSKRLLAHPHTCPTLRVINLMWNAVTWLRMRNLTETMKFFGSIKHKDSCSEYREKLIWKLMKRMNACFGISNAFAWRFHFWLDTTKREALSAEAEVPHRCDRWDASCCQFEMNRLMSRWIATKMPKKKWFWFQTWNEWEQRKTPKSKCVQLKQ